MQLHTNNAHNQTRSAQLSVLESLIHYSKVEQWILNTE